MITIALLFCSLVYIFFDKPELFKRPVSLTKIFVLSILVSIAAFSAIKDYTTDRNQESAHKTIDSLQGETVGQVSLIDSLRRDSHRAADKLAAHDSNTIVLLAKYGLQMDSVKDAIVHKETPPTLALLNAPTIAILNNDTVLKYVLSSLNADAHLLYCYYVFINLIPSKEDSKYAALDTPYVDRETGINFTHIIPPNSQYLVSFQISNLPNLPQIKDDFFIAMEFGYKSKGNKQQTPVRKVYRIRKSQALVHEAENDEFMAVSNHLKKFKIWTTFYDL